MGNAAAASTDDTVDGADCSDALPHKHLPPLRRGDLPQPLRLRALIGPGVVLAAAGIGSGEFVLWPNIAQRAGLDYMWAALLGATFMFFIATEAVRYTLATGETIITGFARLWRGWTVGFILMALIPNLWPGYAMGVATLASFVFGPLDIVLFTVLSLVLIVALLVFAPVVYTLLERAQTVMMGVRFVFLACAVVFVSILAPSVWGDLIGGLANVGQLPPSDVATLPAFAGAIAFAGAGGTVVLLASNYVRDKNLGMGARIPRIVSPLTGQEEPGSNVGFMFPPTDENIRRWKQWWKVMNQEQFLTFFLCTVLAIFVMSALAVATLSGQDAGEGFGFLEVEGRVIGQEFGGFFKTLFFVTGMVALFSTNLGVWDQIGRITADQLKIYLLRESRFWTESRIYATTLVSLLVFSVIVLFSGLQAPLLLLVIVSFLSGITSFVYTALIIQLNRRTLPAYVRMGRVRTAVMSLAVLFYGFFFVITLVNLAREYVL
ncbi:MAG: hypothetical protein QOH46_3922 [Solirubrobacteraceae bacterium]|nr:hypothetical protein [Solirubrobacteraceae bacterium]